MTIKQLDMPMGNSRTEERFRAFHGRNPVVYQMICSKARILARRGFRRYGIMALLNVVRYHSDINPDSFETFSVDNCFAPHYARLVMAQEPDLRDFFATRALKGKATC